MFSKVKNVSKYGVLSYQKHYSTRNILRLKDRGMYEDMFPDSAANTVTDLLNASPQCAYAGFDPTADSLHVGNLLILINLLHWQAGGHKTIALIGGATAQIGDPSGRKTERDQMFETTIENNISGLHKCIKTVFDNHEKYFIKDKQKIYPPMVLNNKNWYKKISAIELIGNSARHLRMGTLLSRTSVQTRLQSPAGMSFTEFSYQLFQAYDWLHLFKTYNCKFQIGGNDQMGNIMSGHELISKACKGSVFGLTMPLVTTEMGDKFGKSAGNAVWLSQDKTSPFTFYQFWMRIFDNDVEKMLNLFTFDSVNSISDLMRRHKEKPELRLPQKHLAEQVTLLVHGEEGLEKAKAASRALYENSVSSLSNMTASEIAELFQGATIVEVLPEAGQNVLDLTMKVGCFSTKQDALRIISAGGFYINQQRVSNPSEVLNMDVHRLASNVSLLRVGKRNYYVVKWLK